MKDSAIKLFGKTIPLRANEHDPSTAENDQFFEESPSSSLSSSSWSSQGEPNHETPQEPSKEENKVQQRRTNGRSRNYSQDWCEDSTDEAKKKESAASVGEESMEFAATSTGINESTATINGTMETMTGNASKTQQEQEQEQEQEKEEKGTSDLKDQKTVKKPDKILPCPRCNSLDTKFCYYNNYNVNQPRHFCKKCQRYWTAGGTMRNVPVGAGRRKNKNSSQHYRHMTLAEALQTARNDMPEAIHHIPLKPNGTVLSFGSDSPLCDSMASVLTLTEKAMRNCRRNGLHRSDEHRIPVSSGSCENGEELSSGSSITASNSGEDGKQQADMQEAVTRKCQRFAPPPPVPCFPAAPWAYPWNSAQWNAPPAAFCASSFPIPFYPAPAYWGCAIPGAWGIPWISPPSTSSTAANGSSSSVPNSPTLGKHTRQGDTLKHKDLENEDSLEEKSSERCLWIPKTLRIDDPGEAARSSIWATLGINKEKKGDGIRSCGGLFKAFQQKTEERNYNAQVLHANPAALSRSLHFQESI